MGLDRLVMVLPESVRARGKHPPDLYLAHLGEAALRKALAIARALRHKGFACHLEVTGGSLKSQMRLADRVGARAVLIIGEDELARNRYVIKRMEDSTQQEVSLEALEEYLRRQRER